MKLLENETGDQAKQAKISVTSATVATHQELKEQIGAFSFNSGWVCFTDRVIPLYNSSEPASLPEGIILSAEFASDTASLHIRQSENGWTVTTFKTGEDIDCLMFCEEYVSTENERQARLKYEVYWKQEKRSIIHMWHVLLA